MPRRLILAHDLGTTGDKAVLVHMEEGVVGTRFASYGTDYPSPTWAEQDPRQWWDAVCQTTRDLLGAHRVAGDDVAAVTFSGQMMGCLPVDGKGRPLRMAIIWADQRAVAEADELVKKVGLENCYRITGHRVSPAYSGPKLMWLTRHQPNVVQETHKFLQAKDFIVHRLTGEWATDHSDACGTGLFDLQRKVWAEELVAAAGVDPAQLPRPVPATTVVGEVTPAAARETGLAPRTPVVIGGGDGVCATAGAGVVVEGTAYVYLGSSAWVAAAARRPFLDPSLRTFTWAHLVPGWYSPNGTMHNAGSAVEWVRSLLGGIEYAALEDEVAAAPPGARGLLFLPYLMGERSPYWNPAARGAFVGLTRKHGRPELIRAVFEGVTFNLRLILDALVEQSLSIQHLRLVGGGAQSKVWRRILADILERPVELVTHPLEATATGAAMAGAVAVGLARDLTEASEHLVRIAGTEPSHTRACYSELFELFRRTYHHLSPVFDDVARHQESTAS